MSLILKAQAAIQEKTFQESVTFFNSELFKRVQNAAIFSDSKIFADAIPKIALDDILKKYEIAQTNNVELSVFVKEYFYLPSSEHIQVDDKNNTLTQYIEHLWGMLRKEADKNTAGSLLPLKYSYIVPGGRFREIYYWDSYFTALGLIESGKVDLVEAMLNNFIDLQKRYACIPNGNRSYYVSRSQPPVLALLVELLLPFKQNKKAFLAQKVEAIALEYNFWMQGSYDVDERHSEHRRVVRMPDGSLLNRYWDDNASPRPESYREDIILSQGLPVDKKAAFYRHIRAACESGWDFSSRWLEHKNVLSSIKTTRILPVDLNSLLYKSECLLADYYSFLGDDSTSAHYGIKAQQRGHAIMQYMWSAEDGFFCDYDLDKQNPSKVKSLAGVLPLFVQLAKPAQAAKVAKNLQQLFLKEGGLITTLINSSQQWDAPNGWAPLQWFAVQGLRQYDHHTLAETIMRRWQNVVASYYHKHGKIMEKYNVCQLDNIAHGGEYNVQEGFGWTNGVYQAFSKLLKEQN